MSNFQGRHLQILTPKTSDGTNPIYDNDRRVVFEETRLPLTAKKHMERENQKRPEHLKHIIKEVG